jgi:transcriptional regulator with XRE-family HTH domain
VAGRRSPTLRRRRLGSELRRLREQAGLTIDQVASALDCSSSKISRIETGQVNATPRDVREILAHYGVAGKRQEELIQLSREARQKAWWQTYDDRVITALIGFEAAATSISSYDASLVPGLLQTVEYARAVTRAVRPTLRPEEVNHRVAVRTARQAHLPEDDPPALWVILDEAVLRRPVGGLGVMVEQVRHLVEAAALPNVTMQVLPFAAGEHAGMDGSFAIYGFAEPADTDVVYLENATSDHYLHRPEEVRRYALVFDHLRAAALKPDDSVAFLAEVVRGLERSRSKDA